jgi:hypothetical protein
MADCRISQNPRTGPPILCYVEQSRDISHIQKQGTEMVLPQKSLHPTMAQWAFRELNEKENEHYIRWLSPRRSNAGGDGRNAIILPGPPRKSSSGAPASGVNARRSLDCAPWADCGERGRWDWTERGSGTPRFRYAILRLSRADDARDKNARFNLFALVIA